MEKKNFTNSERRKKKKKLAENNLKLYHNKMQNIYTNNVQKTVPIKEINESFVKINQNNYTNHFFFVEKKVTKKKNIYIFMKLINDRMDQSENYLHSW